MTGGDDAVDALVPRPPEAAASAAVAPPAPRIPAATPEFVLRLTESKKWLVASAVQDIERMKGRQELWMPPNSSPLPPCPPATKTLVLDMDHTMIENTGAVQEQNGASDFEVRFYDEHAHRRVCVNVRPGLLEFLMEMQGKYQVVVFTTGKTPYAEAVLDELERRAGRKLFPLRRFADACVIGRMGPSKTAPFKNLSFLGRNLGSVVFIDDSAEHWAFQQDNVIPVSAWTRAELPWDTELAQLVPLLHELAGLADVREELRRRLGLSEKVRSFSSSSM